MNVSSDRAVEIAKQELPDALRGELMGVTLLERSGRRLWLVVFSRREMQPRGLDFGFDSIMVKVDAETGDAETVVDM